MIENLSWNAQKEGRFRMNAFLGSRSGSQLAKNSLLKYHQVMATRLAHCACFLSSHSQLQA